MTRAEARALLEELGAARTRFGPPHAARKHALLARCAQLSLEDPVLLRQYHDLLLFLDAHPDDARCRSLVGRELHRVAEAAAAIMQRPTRAERLNDSGIMWSVIESTFSIDTVDWLLCRFPADVELAWEDESLGSALDEFLSQCVARVECDGLVCDWLSTQQWFRLARGTGGGSDLQWLVQRLHRLRCSAGILDQVFDGLDVRVRWRLARPEASLTLGRFPARRSFSHRGPLKRSFSLRRLVARPLPRPRRLARRAAERLIDTARVALALRHRETDPVTYANPGEVTLVGLERGIDAALFGMRPGRRLPIESFFGYLIAKNGVPFAYGGGWVLFDRAEIGINVFDAFRGGESAYVFGQVLRVYRQHFGVRRFLVDPFQFGAGNTDGIRSGAFWFYYRLGFRPVEPALCRLADAEWALVREDRSHRTGRATLRRLTASQLVLDLGAPRRRGDAPDLLDVGLAVTTAIGERFEGDREAAERWGRRRAGRMLGRGRAAGWTPEERASFDRLGLLVSLIPDLGDWSAAEKRALLAIMRAKGGPRERDYALRVQRHAKLRAALEQLARQGREAAAASS